MNNGDNQSLNKNEIETLKLIIEHLSKINQLLDEDEVFNKIWKQNFPNTLDP